MKTSLFCTLLLSILFITTGCRKDDAGEGTVFTASGDINTQLGAFRNTLGSVLNTTPGVQGGRREINWDGVPDSLLGGAMPSDFFNPTAPGAPDSRKRGLAYSGDGSFRVSRTSFSEINSQAAMEFSPFSGAKTFANTNSLLWDIGFRVPGTNTPASVNGFGLVVIDVDVPNSFYIEPFSGNQSLGRYYAPIKSNGSPFSLLGVHFPNTAITRIRVGHDGKLADGLPDISQGGAKDMVVLDDFLYSEPVAQQ
jgi:hypothetical protein